MNSKNICVCIMTAAVMLFLFAGVALCSDTDTNAPAGSSTADTGPTVTLSYGNSKIIKNPSSSFMYFVPLIAPTHVDMIISRDNNQQAWIISYTKKVTKKTFYVACEFEMRGNGFFNNILDHNEVIANFPEEVKKRSPIKNALDYIKFEGEGIGRYEAWGTIAGHEETVDEVRVTFNAGGNVSPISIGLFSVNCENGHYNYSRRYNEMVARAATLTFKRGQKVPRMAVSVESVNNASNPNGSFGGLVGFFANFFIDPVRVSSAGNDTMLNFGYNMFLQNQTFTFPKAANIRSSTTQ